MPKPIQRVKFTKAIARHTKIRDQNPSLGYICPGEPHERSPNAPKFEDREHPEVSSSWEMPEVQSLINDTSVQHGWSDVSLEFENSTIEKQNRVHESEQDGSQVSKKLLKYFVEMVDGNVTRDLFT